MSSTWWAASTRALTPASGSRPACAARPSTATWKVPQPLRPVFSATAVRGALEHQHGAAGRRPLLDECPRGARADLLVGRHEDLDARQVVQRGEAVDRLHQAAQHVEDAGPGRPPVLDPERAACKGADREHRVVVAEDEHPRGRRRRTSGRAARPRSRRAPPDRPAASLGSRRRPWLTLKAARSREGDSTSTSVRRSSIIASTCTSAALGMVTGEGYVDPVHHLRQSRPTKGRPDCERVEPAQRRC